jgi:PAS domain S-box-containing protein
LQVRGFRETMARMSESLLALGFGSSELLAEIVRQVAHPMFVKDRAGRHIWANQATCDLLGLPPEAFLGKTSRELFPDGQADELDDRDRRVFETGATVLVDEESITDALGCVHVLATTKVPLRASGGEVTHILGICHEISRLKAVEEALRVANEELERRVEERTRALRDAQLALLRKERLAVLGQLSGGLAHQIRTPLAAISNAIAVVRRRVASAEDPIAEEAVAIIDEEIWEANRIITDLLDFVRVRPPSRAPVSVSALIDGALSAVRALEGITIVRDVDEDVIALVDEPQTRDALGNLLRNAVEAMGERGRLTLRARATPPFACIAVEDTGPGVAEEARVHLFEPLITTKALGLGLGLTTARALIENQQGDLRYVKTGEEGACFEIRVPLATAEPA